MSQGDSAGRHGAPLREAGRGARAGQGDTCRVEPAKEGTRREGSATPELPQCFARFVSPPRPLKTPTWEASSPRHSGKGLVSLLPGREGAEADWTPEGEGPTLGSE